MLYVVWGDMVPGPTLKSVQVLLAVLVTPSARPPQGIQLVMREASNPPRACAVNTFEAWLRCRWALPWHSWTIVPAGEEWPDEVLGAGDGAKGMLSGAGSASWWYSSAYEELLTRCGQRKPSPLASLPNEAFCWGKTVGCTPRGIACGRSLERARRIAAAPVSGSQCCLTPPSCDGRAVGAACAGVRPCRPLPPRASLPGQHPPSCPQSGLVARWVRKA